MHSTAAISCKEINSDVHRGDAPRYAVSWHVSTSYLPELGNHKSRRYVHKLRYLAGTQSPFCCFDCYRPANLKQPASQSTSGSSHHPPRFSSCKSKAASISWERNPTSPSTHPCRWKSMGTGCPWTTHTRTHLLLETSAPGLPGYYW